MNEQYITVGMNKNGTGFYAMWCNESTILSGDTPLEAIKSLLDETKMPIVWYTDKELEPSEEEYKKRPITSSILKAMKVLDKHDIRIKTLHVPEDLVDKMKKGRKIVEDSNGTIKNEFDVFCDAKDYGYNVKTIMKNEDGRIFGVKIISYKKK